MTKLPKVASFTSRPVIRAAWLSSKKAWRGSKQGTAAPAVQPRDAGNRMTHLYAPAYRRYQGERPAVPRPVTPPLERPARTRGTAGRSRAISHLNCSPRLSWPQSCCGPRVES